ncbi:MAG: leucine-rich repeat domain-containing protein [Prevotella sp.]|uniref:leucine-rich repeat domain-containing protein n=1 Tax=Prevotella sp. TaxID=59823 RepID=UPI002A34B55D|nr:leucine-rich repeat domain-containing protein [Prevotella sp.]MDD7317268.1 leucine-rich repeat domain-containing protein [Prevotellaceae bacterium]MDY4019872.1 leucine-rich repeat domain-containing protein [Prevotella sp.]
MKKIFFSLLLLAGISVQAQEAKEFTDGNFKFVKTGDNTAEITGFATDATAETLIIPATATDGTATYDVTSVGASAFTASYSGGPTEITIPSSVKRIGKNAFSGSSSKFFLKTLNLSEGLEYIGESAFYANGIEHLTIPASVDTIAATAFLFSPKMQTIELREGLKYIGKGAFTSGTYAYNTNNVLKSVTLPFTVEFIGNEAFLNNATLESINIPKQLATLGECVIGGTVVRNITIDEGCENFIKVGDAIYNKEKTILYLAPIKGITSLTVEPGTLGINGGTFWDSDLEEITLPEGLVGIGFGAFENSQLRSVNFPKSLVFIDEQAFAETKLTEVTLPENVPYINDAQFYGCKSLTKVIVPSCVKQIYNHAFAGCTALKDIVCLSSGAPDIMDMYEEYDHPFYGFTPSMLTITVPKDASDSYTTEGYGEYMKIVESNKGTILPISITPANGSELYAVGNLMEYTLTFDDNVILTDNTPDVHIRKGSNWSTAQIYAEGGWTATQQGNTVIIRGLATDNNTAAFDSEAEKEYHLIIPAGLVTNAAGETNEWLDVKFIGSETVNAISNAATEASTVNTPTYNIAGQRVSPDTKGIVIQNGKKRLNR